MQLVRLISSISPPIFGIVTCVYISGRPLLSSPREWKIRHGHKTRAILPGAAWWSEKTRFCRRNVCISVGSGKATVGLWVSRDVFLKARTGSRKRGGCGDRAEGSGGSAPPLPGKGAPSPACGSVVVPATGNVSRRSRFLFCFVPDLTLATSKVGGLRHRRILICVFFLKKRILLSMNTFLFLSGNTSLTERRAVPPPCLQFLYRPHFAPSLPPFF